MDNRILEIRRVFANPNKKTPNPDFNPDLWPNYKNYLRAVKKESGLEWMEEYPFLEDDPHYTPNESATPSSHIEYKMKCIYCGTSTWVRRRDAKYCTPGCRKLHYEKKKRDTQKDINK